jgi:hypothetical protein
MDEIVLQLCFGITIQIALSAISTDRQGLREGSGKSIGYFVGILIGSFVVIQELHLCYYNLHAKVFFKVTLKLMYFQSPFQALLSWMYVSMGLDLAWRENIAQ